MIKLAIAAILPLSADEAYYWVWSHKLDIGYYDHPPFIAWLFALGHPLEFFGHAVRWPAVLLAHLVPWIWWPVLEKYLPPGKRLLWAFLFFLCPLTGLGGIVLTPDLPLLVFWSLALRSLFHYLEEPRPRTAAFFGWWLGLGFCSKYHIVLLPLSLAPLLLKKDWRDRLGPRFFIPAFAMGLLGCLPVLLWNLQRDFLSFRFQLGHGLSGHEFRWQWPAEYLLGQLVLLTPAVLWAAWRAPRNRTGTVLLFTAFGPLLFFALTSLRASTEINWPAMAYPGVFALAAFALGTWGRRLSLAFWVVLQLAIFAALGFPEKFHLHEKILEPYRFLSLRELPKQEPPLFASSYQMASSLWYLSKVPVYKLAGMNRFDMYDLWGESTPSGQSFRLLTEEGKTLPEIYSGQGWRVIRTTSPAPGLELWEVRRE
ncbi:MAG: glycosyltransferase family 39 protein [Bdellovibrionaceae bacterium]|nr:glycosyltransferase family 39 protein [Pseudobdellovibrionaceae bacterium]MBX3033584.1 glycosyltransferase family 39 protein [Pseudobdellovibrionaceae bacterium]